MLTYTIRRLLMLIPVLLGMALVVFFMIRAIPGDPAQVILGQQATQESISQLTEKLGLNDPWYVQFVRIYERNLNRGFRAIFAKLCSNC